MERFKYVCSGCGLDPIPDGEVYPQGKEYYCRRCNKLYPLFIKERAAALTELDAIRAKKVEEVKRKVFGSADRPQPEQNAKRPVLDADGNAVSDEMIEKIKSMLSAEPGNSDVSMALLEDSDKAAVEAKEPKGRK